MCEATEARNVVKRIVGEKEAIAPIFLYDDITFLFVLYDCYLPLRSSIADRPMVDEILDSL